MFVRYYFLFPCLVLFTGTQYARGTIMGYEYIQEASTWLRLHTVPATWHEARLRCRLEGGILASPTTEALTKAMLDMLTTRSSANNSMFDIRGIFTGINDLASKGDFVSLEGIPLRNIPVDWGRTGASLQDCLLLGNFDTGAQRGSLIDASCDTELMYFCRKESARMTVNECGNTDPEYKLEPRTGSCYKFHRVGRTWHRAQMACHAEGGHLAIINSDTESQVLKEIFADQPDDTIATNDPIYASSALVGYWKWNDEDGEWLTLNGESLAEAGFEKWGEQQPNNIGGDQYCGAIERNGLLNDVSCSGKQVPFICEITPQPKIPDNQLSHSQGPNAFARWQSWLKAKEEE